MNNTKDMLRLMVPVKISISLRNSNLETNVIADEAKLHCTWNEISRVRILTKMHDVRRWASEKKEAQK